jgi:polygalacturonase
MLQTTKSFLFSLPIIISLGLTPVISLAQYSWTNLPTVKETSFKRDTFDIRKYGAIADGNKLNTESINNAITACNKSGGGVVMVSAGLWMTGPVEMKSNVNLYLQNGALLLFTTDKSKYALVEGSYEGKPAARNQSPIWGKNLGNIAITGQGIIDGNGDAWRAVGKGQLTPGEWKAKMASGGVLNKDSSSWYPSAQFLKARDEGRSMLLAPGKPLSSFEDMKDFLRPNLVVFTNCKRVLLEGVIFQNSAAWCLHPLMCEDLVIRNVTVKNPEYAQNGDGMDIESCSNFLIENSILDVGDDAICIKSGKDEEGRKRGMPTQNGIIRNNTIYKGHGGVVIGSEMSGGARNIFVENCTFMGTDKGLRFKSARGRGGVVENIYARNLAMNNIVDEAIFFDLFYSVTFATDGVRNTNPELSEATPVFRNMVFENIVCNGAKKGIFIRGLPEMPVSGITIKNCTLNSKIGAELIDAAGISFENIRFNTMGNEVVLKLDNVNGFKVSGLGYLAAKEKVFRISGNRTRAIDLVNAGITITAKNAEVMGDVPKDAVLLK